MKTVKLWLHRVLGCIGVSVAFVLFVFGAISVNFKLLFGADCSGYLALVLLFFVFAILLSCNLLYAVNHTLWDSVASAEKGSILKLLPNIKIIVELCEYIGGKNLLQ